MYFRCGMKNHCRMSGREKKSTLVLAISIVARFCCLCDSNVRERTCINAHACINMRTTRRNGERRTTEKGHTRTAVLKGPFPLAHYIHVIYYFYYYIYERLITARRVKDDGQSAVRERPVL